MLQRDSSAVAGLRRLTLGGSQRNAQLIADQVSHKTKHSLMFKPDLQVKASHYPEPISIAIDAIQSSLNDAPNPSSLNLLC